MKIYIKHGRLGPHQSGTTLDGTPIEDWGFEGPTLEGCLGFHWTYGRISSLVFDSADSYRRAFSATNWPDGIAENSLQPEIRGDCLRIYSAERKRYEYFGDWGMK